jgi:hypothetical protein
MKVLSILFVVSAGAAADNALEVLSRRTQANCVCYAPPVEHFGNLEHGLLKGPRKHLRATSMRNVDARLVLRGNRQLTGMLKHPTGEEDFLIGDDHVPLVGPDGDDRPRAGPLDGNAGVNDDAPSDDSMGDDGVTDDAPSDDTMGDDGVTDDLPSDDSMGDDQVQNNDDGTTEADICAHVQCDDNEICSCERICEGPDDDVSMET